MNHFPRARALPGKKAMGHSALASPDEKKVIKYIRNQRQHHAKRSFKDEYLEFLIQNEVDYDEKYLWN